MNIKGRFVTTSGGTPGDPINICWADHCQADPVVTFDSVNSRFCIAWEDGRDSNPPDSYVYDLRASLIV